MAGKPIPIGPGGRQVAENVRRLRKARGFSQNELAARWLRAGHPVVATVVTKAEAGDRRVDVDDLMALTVALDVTVDELLLPAGQARRGDGSRAVDLTVELLDAVRDVVDPALGTDVPARARTARRLMAQLALELDEITDATDREAP